MSKYRVLSVNDDKDFCGCCGKTGLKRVVFIENIETGEVDHFGTTCATQPAKGFGLDSEIKREIQRFQAREKTLGYLAYHAYKKAGGQYIANADGHSWRAADPALLAQCRSEIAARGFNY